MFKRDGLEQILQRVKYVSDWRFEIVEYKSWIEEILFLESFEFEDLKPKNDGFTCKR